LSSPIPTPTFKLTAKQQEANRLLASLAQHIMLFGGSRSGKTFLIVRAIVTRALKAPNSRHLSVRFRLGHIKSSIVMDTFPKVMRLCYPQVHYELNKSDLYAQFENGSEYWFGGLDDKERTEKILGNEYATIHPNECSQIPYNSRNLAVTRLAQLVYQKIDGQERVLPLKMYYDENPPDKGHWTYKLFVLKQDPETKRPLADPERYTSMQLNPGDNQENLGADYLKTLQGLSPRLQKRFLLGQFRETAPNALFVDEVLDRWRVTDENLPEMLRIVVAVDPSGADDEDNQDNDEIGIVVCGLGIDGIGYVLEDITCKAGPATWGRVATQAFERHQANTIVAEVNFGGAMVKHVIRSARPRTPFKEVRASRGKVVRAEPISSLMETGKVRLAGLFPNLEDELQGFTTHGFMGSHSPNHADAMIWGMSELFPSILAVKDEKPPAEPAEQGYRPRNDSHGWMGS
jgi:predicted phage terminase large subunit-like protein